jgi:hypothetical protein
VVDLPHIKIEDRELDVFKDEPKEENTEHSGSVFTTPVTSVVDTPS